jgi:hypothetical protein
MNGRRAKWIRQLVIEFNPFVFTTIQNRYGSLIKNRQPRTIYRMAKRMWKQHEKGTEKWVRMPPPNPINKQETTEGELANGRNDG